MQPWSHLLQALPEKKINTAFESMSFWHPQCVCSLKQSFWCLLEQCSLTGGRQSSLAISVFLIFRASSICKRGHYKCRNVWEQIWSTMRSSDHTVNVCVGLSHNDSPISPSPTLWPVSWKQWLSHIQMFWIWRLLSFHSHPPESAKQKNQVNDQCYVHIFFGVDDMTEFLLHDEKFYFTITIIYQEVILCYFMLLVRKFYKCKFFLHILN